MASAPDLDALWADLGWTPDAGQLAQLQALQCELRHWNQRLNLTRLVEGDDYWIAQVVDSLWPLVDLLNGRAGSAKPQIVDVGTGGGFPGLAVAIAMPTANLTLVDSAGRKLEAVGAMAGALGLAGRVTLRHERAERTGRAAECRGRFDWALARAVAPASVVAEYLVPLLNAKGQAVLYRGQWGQGDQLGLERAAARLMAKVVSTERRDLPGGRGIRHVLRMQPEAPCPPAFPRAVGIPRRHPISEP